MSEPTVFQWWAELAIPWLVGIATIAVALAAIIATRRATWLAHEVEQFRIDEGRRRDADESRRDLLATSQAEARTVRRWIHFVVDYRHGVVTSSNRYPKEAEGAATVSLEQSFIPRAVDLLSVTRHDLSG